jgi:hypothetical protein
MGGRRPSPVFRARPRAWRGPRSVAARYFLNWNFTTGESAPLLNSTYMARRNRHTSSASSS